MHPIQQEILKRILCAPDGIRFSMGKSENIENDQYNYHLKQLIKSGLLRKYKNFYKLSEKGKHYIEEENPINPLGHIADRFKVAALTCLIRKQKEKFFVLYQTRGRHPMFGFKNIPGGPSRKGEPITETAKRKLKEETGLDADFEVAGVIRKIRKGSLNSIFSDIFYFICISKKYTGQLIERNEFGNNYWIELDKAINLEMENINGSDRFVEFLKNIKTNKICGFFYTEEHYN